MATTLVLRGVNKLVFKDITGKWNMQVGQQLRGYRIADPAQKRQQPVSPLMLRCALRWASTKRETLIAHLLIGAFFFACRSCKYVRTFGEPRTKILAVEDIQFLKKVKNTILIVDPTEEGITAVRLKFRQQKNLVKDEEITQHASGGDLCPVRAWQYVCMEARKANKKGARTVNIFDGAGGDITYKDIEGTIRQTVAVLSKTHAHLDPSDYGTHSIRSGAALAMYLAGTAVVDIMLQGRWCSDAFLLYIKRQVLERSAGISANMLEIADFDRLPPRKHQAVLDRSRSSLGHRGSSRTLQATSPSFHLHH